MDVEATLVHGTEADLNELRSWLFRENIRLDIREIELNKAQKEFDEACKKREMELYEMYQKFLQEREQFRYEMNLLQQKSTQERQRVRQESEFLDKKVEILKNGFVQLEEDRRALERERERLRAREDYYAGYESRMMSEDRVALLFYGADTLLLLKKRYKDLVKIFHPDSLGGDQHLFREITAKYEQLQIEIRRNMQA